MEILVAGFGFKSLKTTCFAEGENQEGNLYSLLEIFLYITAVFGSLKGRKPARSTKRMTPQDHASAFAPS